MIPLSDSPRTKFPFFTALIICIAILVFAMQLFGDSEGILLNYSLIPKLIDSGDLSVLRFITAIFLHGGILHLVFNLWFLWVFGDNIEERFGPKVFILIFLISGAIGNYLQYVTMVSSFIPILGSSGAIAGILGAYFILFPHTKIKTLIPVLGVPIVAHIPTVYMLGYWFVLQVIPVLFSSPTSLDGGGIAFFTHIGGFITGAALAAFYKSSIKQF